MTHQLKSIIVIIVVSLWMDSLANGECVLARSDCFFLAFESTFLRNYVKYVADRNVEAPPVRKASDLYRFQTMGDGDLP